MAYILCSKHGGSGAAAVCSHIAARLTSVADPSVAAEPLFPVRATFAGSTLGPTWLCAECAREHSVPAEGLHLHGDDGLDRYFDTIGFTPVCPACFAAVFTRPA